MTSICALDFTNYDLYMKFTGYLDSVREILVEFPGHVNLAVEDMRIPKVGYLFRVFKCQPFQVSHLSIWEGEG